MEVNSSGACYKISCNLLKALSYWAVIGVPKLRNTNIICKFSIAVSLSPVCLWLHDQWTISEKSTSVFVCMTWKNFLAMHIILISTSTLILSSTCFSTHLGSIFDIWTQADIDQFFDYHQGLFFFYYFLHFLTWHFLSENNSPARCQIQL